jgi:cytidylate kinase
LSAAPPSPLVVAIDGPSGVGKSTLARRLATRLGIPYLDTGAMYRALGLRALERNVDPADAEAVGAIAEGVDITLQRERDGRYAVLLDGQPVEPRIRSQAVADATSRIATLPAVRAKMVALQRACAAQHGAVVEGRDIGTKVFPDTPHKFFLDARPAVRAARRAAQLRRQGHQADAAEIEREIANRDARDREREDSPLRHDGSYVVLDTSDLSIDEIVERMLASIERRRSSDAG